MEKYQHPDWDQPIANGSYVHALVTDVTPERAQVKFGRYTATLNGADISWTKHKSPQEILVPGDLAYLKVIALNPDQTARVLLDQDSGAQGALLALDNATGDIKAMVGGRDFQQSKFNRTTQAQRQVGSSFKPFVYTAAVDQGAEPDDIILDAPTTFLSGGVPADGVASQSATDALLKESPPPEPAELPLIVLLVITTFPPSMPPPL